jgi:hypothetical protein
MGIGDAYVYSNEKRCNLCGKRVKELFILKPERFNKNCPKRIKECREVCVLCAKKINWRGYYSFGRIWCDFLIDLRFNIYKPDNSGTIRERKLKEVVH